MAVTVGWLVDWYPLAADAFLSVVVDAPASTPGTCLIAASSRYGDGVGIAVI
ncbi:MAG: hypothetical protein FWD80_05835 [Propionibacteriaceae bacterium]|nr:hypothetical protein [Propionibacteriaceae bacterium]